MRRRLYTNWPEGADGSVGGENLARGSAQVPAAQGGTVLRDQATRHHQVRGASYTAERKNSK